MESLEKDVEESDLIVRSVRCLSSITCNVSGIYKASILDFVFVCVLMRASTNTILCSDYYIALAEAPLVYPSRVIQVDPYDKQPEWVV